MVLYTCNQAGAGPALLHPCAKAVKALDEAGHAYEIKKVDGYRAMPWTRSGDARTEVKELSGQPNVPILVFDDGEVISGSGTIADWAKSTSPA
jgi:glutathione S-transferase